MPLNLVRYIDTTASAALLKESKRAEARNGKLLVVLPRLTTKLMIAYNYLGGVTPLENQTAI